MAPRQRPRWPGAMARVATQLRSLRRHGLFGAERPMPPVHLCTARSRDQAFAVLRRASVAKRVRPLRSTPSLNGWAASVMPEPQSRGFAADRAPLIGNARRFPSRFGTTWGRECGTVNPCGATDPESDSQLQSQYIELVPFRTSRSFNERSGDEGGNPKRRALAQTP